MTVAGRGGAGSAGAHRGPRRISFRSLVATELSPAALLGFMAANYALSYAALLFAGTGPAGLGRGLAMLLLASAVAMPAGALWSSLPATIIVADGTLIALLASVLGGIVADMAGAPPAAVVSTAAVTLMLATVVTGAALWLVGWARAGGAIRFLPFQVVAGLLAASGWSLAIGGASVALGHAARLADLLDPRAATHLLPTVAIGLLLLAITTRFRRPAMLPATILALMALHHAGFAALGWSLEQQRDAGLLVAAPQLAIAMPWVADLASVDWTELRGHALGILALLPLSAVCLLLNVTGFESIIGQDADVDRELKVGGAVAVLGGALGGVLAITSVSRSGLAFAMGVRSRRVGVMAGVLGGLVPLAWPGLLELVPRSLPAGLLIFSGLNLLRVWVVRSRAGMSASEWATVLAVLAISANLGLVAGAFAGLLLGCVTFAAIYSQGSPIRARYRGEAARSQVDRSEAERAVLASLADTVLVLHLQGFVFFGTASRLLREIRGEIAARPGRLRHLVLDFGNVDGVDGSALASLDRLQRIAAAERIVLLLTGLSGAVEARLRARTFGAGTMLGEVGFCLGLPRTATVVADQPCRLLRLTRAAMLQLEEEQPEAALAFQRAVMRRLGARLLDKDQLIAALVLERSRS